MSGSLDSKWSRISVSLFSRTQENLTSSGQKRTHQKPNHNVWLLNFEPLLWWKDFKLLSDITKDVYGQFILLQQSLKFGCFHGSILIWLQLQNQLWVCTFDLSFPLSASCTSAIFGHHLQVFFVTRACNHHITVHMTLMAKKNQSLLDFQWNIHVWCQEWGGSGLTCSVQGPEQMWSRTPPPGNWLGQGGLPVNEKRAAASEHKQITDAPDAGRW